MNWRTFTFCESGRSPPAKDLSTSGSTRPPHRLVYTTPTWTLGGESESVWTTRDASLRVPTGVVPVPRLHPSRPSGASSSGTRVQPLVHLGTSSGVEWAPGARLETEPLYYSGSRVTKVVGGWWSSRRVLGSQVTWEHTCRLPPPACGRPSRDL